MDVPAAKKPLYTSTVEVPPLAETKPGPSAEDAFDPVVQEEKRLEKRKARKAKKDEAEEEADKLRAALMERMEAAAQRASAGLEAAKRAEAEAQRAARAAAAHHHEMRQKAEAKKAADRLAEIELKKAEVLSAQKVAKGAKTPSPNKKKAVANGSPSPTQPQLKGPPSPDLGTKKFKKLENDQSEEQEAKDRARLMAAKPASEPPFFDVLQKAFCRCLQSSATDRQAGSPSGQAGKNRMQDEMSHSPQKTRLPQQWLNCGEWCPPPQPKPEAKRRMQDESPTPAAEQKQAEQVERWPSIESERNPVAPSGFMSWMRPSARGIPSTPGTAWLYERGAPTARTFNRLRLSQLANPIKGSARLASAKKSPAPSSTVASGRHYYWWEAGTSQWWPSSHRPPKSVRDSSSLGTARRRNPISSSAAVIWGSPSGQWRPGALPSNMFWDMGPAGPRKSEGDRMLATPPSKWKN